MEPVANQAPTGLARQVGASPTPRLTRWGRRTRLTALIDIEMQGFIVCAFEFVTLDVKEIGPSDVFAEIGLQLHKDAKRKRFCRKIFDLCRRCSTASGSERGSIHKSFESIARYSSRYFIEGRPHRWKIFRRRSEIKKSPLLQRQSLLTSHRRGNNFRSAVATGCD